MEPAREGDQLREDFLEAIAQNILLDIKLAVSSSIHEAVQKSPPHITNRHTHINEKTLPLVQGKEQQLLCWSSREQIPHA